MNYLALVIILFILAFFGEKIIGKALGVKREPISETPGKRVDRRGRGIIAVIFLCALPYVISADSSVIKWFCILYFLLTMGFDLFLEWKYLRHTKQHIITLVFMVAGLIALFNIEFLMDLFGLQ